jgi:hypothetical protein
MLFHVPDSRVKALKHSHEHTCTSWWCNVNIANIKKQKVATVEKSKHHEMMQATRIHHTHKNELP